MLGMGLFQPLFAQKQVVVDPNAQVRVIQGSFRALSVSSGIEVFLNQADEYGLAVSSSREKNIDQIMTEIVNGELKIYLKDKSLRIGNQKYRAYVAAPGIDKIRVSSASDVVIAGVWKADSLKINVSSASDLVGELDVKYLRVNVSGASDVILSGKADAVKMDASGASDIKAFNLSAGTGHLDANGASDIQVTVTGELNAEASGASYIKYRGSANVVQSNVSGSSTIKKGK